MTPFLSSARSLWIFLTVFSCFSLSSCKQTSYDESDNDKLPLLYINTPDGEDITSKEEWIKGTLLSLTQTDNPGLSFNDLPTSIRGRGNSTWEHIKKPYAIKLDKKREVLGMPEHKRWVLIANYRDNTFIRNSMAFYVSQQLDMDYTVRGQFVMLNLNGIDKGLYWLGEAIKVDKNRVDIDEDNDFLIELDEYYDEVWKFRSTKKAFPYMIKNDDAMTDERLLFLQEKIAALEALLYPACGDAPDETYAETIDLDSWIKFYLVNELMYNPELKHPKSCYLTYSVTDNKLKAGPVWDFDWAALSQSDCCLMNTLYYDALFQSPAFTHRLKEIWNEYKEKIDIETQIEHLRKSIYKGQEADTRIWEPHLDPSGIARNGFDEYVDFLKETLLLKYSALNRMVEGL
ncbi:MAG: CotH kinase family protein [Bacteroides sp.]|nr:CotH kinase family protein [Bacteroides sp.]MCM1086368.1 CotH kinase family protein [Bacteroides sp.]